MKYFRLYGLRFLVALCGFFAALPNLTLAVLYGFAWHCTRLIGHFPRPYQDDPKGILHDPAYRLIDSLLCETHSQFGLVTLSFFSPLIFLILLTVCWRRVLPWQRASLILLYVCGMVLLCFEPGRRLEWYLD